MNLDNRKVIELPLDDILPNRFQPRITFSEEAINELAESIKEHGVIQPIVVRKINDKYEIIAGERRYKASTIAGKTTIPAIITDLNDKESAEIALIENVQREDLTPIEEAVSYKKILDMGYLTQEDLSSKLGKKQSTISNKLRLLNLDEEVQEALLEKKISERHARSLLRLNSKDQKKMLNRIITERLTVRKTDEEIEKFLHPEKSEKNVDKVSDDIEILEVLDLDETSKKEEGKIKMNNEINNNFNIPGQSIIEDIPNNNVQSNTVTNISEMNSNFNIPGQSIIEDVNSSMQTVSNPGFMDVNKIAETATDINVEKPVANMNDLLQSTPMATTQSAPSVDTSIFGFTPIETKTETQSEPFVTDSKLETNQEELMPGKFFNLNSLGEIAETAAPHETTAANISAMLNNSVNQPETNIEQTVENTTVSNNDNTSSMFGINLEPKNPNYVGNVEEKEANIDFGIPTSVIENNNLNFDSFFQNGNDIQQTATVAETLKEPVNTEISTVSETENNQNLENQLFETQNLNSVSSVQSVPTASIDTAVQPQTLEPQLNVQSQASISYAVPSTDELDAFLSNLDSSTPISNMAANTVVNDNVIAVSTPNVTDVQGKMVQVKTIMSEAKQKIEALGIRIELDEFDFDDMYQAIFKIDK